MINEEKRAELEHDARRDGWRPRVPRAPVNLPGSNMLPPRGWERGEEDESGEES